MRKTLLMLACLSAGPAWAACERADVSFYLDKGFSPEQITQLCAAAPKAASVAPATVVPVVKSQAVVQSDEQSKILMRLGDALKVRDLNIESGVLSFKQTFKAKYGEEDVFGNLQEVKPVMQISIALSSMRLIRSAKRIPVLRGAYVLLSGDIQQQVLHKAQYKPKQLAGIETFLAEEVGQNTVKIQVLADANIDRVATDLQELSLLYR